ncbi:hypothetical protein FKM82_029910 [Ascaphus truei]
MPGSERIELDFPHYSSVLLDSLNKQRLEGKFCDLSVQVQGSIFRAHKTVLAASSPYFHDKLLLNDTSCLVLPSVIQPDAFESLLQLIYSGRLCLEMEALPSHLMVASGLQMWQVVDRCSELLKEKEPHPPPSWSSRASESQSPSSSFQPPREDPPHTSVSLVCSDDDEVIQVRVSEEEEEEEEEDEEEEMQSGGNAEEEPATCSYALPSSSSSEIPKMFYIKQERAEEENGFLKALGMAEVQAMCKAEYPADLSFVISPPSSDTSLCLPRRLHGVPETPSFPLSKPVDLHGNEIIDHVLQAQTVHAPIKLVASPDGKKFGCLCGKRFAVKPKRDRHIMLTFSLRPFGCSVCNKRFKLKHHLTEHMKTHGGNVYSCEDCGRKFRVESCFEKHKEVCKGQRWAMPCWT